MHQRTSSPGGFVQRILFRALALIGVAAVLAALNILANPRSPRYGEGILEDNEIRLADIGPDTDVFWVDARSKADYDREHVDGAILVNMEDFYVQLSAFVSRYRSDQTCVVYCASLACDTSRNIAELLKKETGAQKVYSLYGGWEEIQRSKLSRLSQADELRKAQAQAEARRIAAENAKKERQAREAAEALKQEMGTNAEATQQDNEN